MRRRPFFNSQPEPGEKPAGRHGRLLWKLEKRRMEAACLAAATGLGSALALHLLRKKELSDLKSQRGQKARELEKLGAKTAGYAVQHGRASHGDVDSFLASVRSEMISDLRGQIQSSDLLILEMESENPGLSFVRDSGTLTAAFAAAIALGVFSIRMLAKREERKAAKKKDAPKPRERKNAVQAEDIAHAPTCIPAPASPPASEKFPRPPYFSELFEDLKNSVREEMRSPGSEEAAEALLCVMPRKEVEELIKWPETIEFYIASHRRELEEFLSEKGIDPKALFRSLGGEVTSLF